MILHHSKSAAVHSLLPALLFGVVAAHAQVQLSTSTPYTQDFTSLGTSVSATLPSPFRVDRQAAANTQATYAAAGTTTTAAGGVNVSSTASNGIYNFGANDTNDRALGFIASGSNTGTGNLYVLLANNTGSPLNGLQLSYNIEKYRNGSRSFSIQLYYSTDGASWTSAGPAFLTTFPADANNSGFATAPGATVPVSGTLTTAIPNGSNLYLLWSYTPTSGTTTTNAQGLAVDDISILGTGGGTTSTNPQISGTANPFAVNPGAPVTLSGTLTAGTNPASTSYTVSCDLTPVGGSSTTPASVNGTGWTLATSVPAAIAPGTKTLVCTVADQQSRQGTANIVLVVQDLASCGQPANRISQIQGSGLTSQMVGSVVTVEGIVVGDFQSTTKQLSGFYLEQPLASQDGDPSTSEGIFVFDNGRGVDVSNGDRVRVTGTVSEFASSGSSLTELGSISSKIVCGSGNVITPVDVTLPVNSTTDLERYEGMLVRITTPLVVTGNFSLGTFGQIDLAPSVLYQPTQTTIGPANWAAAADLNKRSTITLDDASVLANANLYPTLFPTGGLSAANTLRVGARINYNQQSGQYTPLTGIMDDRFGAYRIEPTQAVTFDNSPNPRPNPTAVLSNANVGGRFRLFGGNVLNFFTTLGKRGAATPTEYSNQLAKITAELVKANSDIYGLSEVQNFANGNTSGDTYSNTAVQALVDSMNAVAGAGTYSFIDTVPAGTLNGTDAIRNVIIYKPSRVTPVGSFALLNNNDQNRPSLAQTFRPAAGTRTDLQTFTFVVNHFRSKGSACGGNSDDAYQGNCNGMRLNMAQNVASWLATNPTSDPAGANRRIVMVGDFNAYLKEDPIQFLAGAGYTDLIESVIGAGASSYNFGSQAGYLDHALANTSANRLVKNVVEWHINADEPSSLQAYDSSLKSAQARTEYYSADEFAASDHDPFVVGFNPLCGDLNDDGTVDNTDQTIMRTAIGKAKATVDRRTDMDNDGVVSLTDFRLWSQCAAAFQR